MVAVLPLAWLLSGCNEDSVEKQLGSATASSIEGTYRVNRDPVLNDWNRDVGRTLTAFSTRQQIPYSFKVIDTDMVNAFAAPWGYVYVTQGFLDFADSEDEVVAVLGHEIGHVVHRDGIKGFKQSLLFSLAAGLIGSKNETLGEVTAIGLGLLSLHYSREQEYAADDTGTAMSYAAGYDPRGLLTFFTKLHTDLEKGRPSSYLDALLSSHPYTPNRKLRQEEQPWVMASTAPSAMRIAQGHLKRGQYNQALAVLNVQAAREPENTQLALMVADALAGRGTQGPAREKYLTASTQGSGSYPSFALAQMARDPAPALVLPTGEEQGRALALAASAETAVTGAQETSRKLAAARQAIGGKLQAAHADNSAAMAALGRLAEAEADLTKPVEKVALNANAAVAAAADVMSTLDVCQEQTAAAVRDNAEVARQAGALLQELAQGRGRSGVLPLAESALRELGRSNQLLLASAVAVRLAIGPTMAAQSSARQTTTYIERLFDLRRVRQGDLELARMLTRETRDRTKEANRQAQEAQRRARVATTRAMLASLQLAQAAASAEMLPGLDRMVAHYMRTSPGQVATLRERGLGYGDIVVVAVSARGSGTPFGTQADALTAGAAPMDAFDLKRDQSQGLKVMVKFLSKAMAREVALPGSATTQPS